jgi:hypothetical protein
MELICVPAERSAGWNVESSKLEELRSKTDQQLIKIIDSDLDAGIHAARQALNSAGRRTVSAKQSYCRAERAHGDVSRLLPFMCEVAGDEFERWEVKLGLLGNLLKELAAVYPR